MRLDQNPLTCQCEKQNKTKMLEGFKFRTFIGRSQVREILAVKGLILLASCVTIDQGCEA